MSKALYRKYRPAVFADVVGQPAITTTLSRQVDTGRPSHAYLFTGSRGTGKTTCAKILAKAVNCLTPQNGDPCNTCALCTGIDGGTVMDVFEIDAASNNGVEHVRDLRAQANFTPSAGRYRVYIIDEVHMLSDGAFNALLKVLEEPPAHVIFILATTEVHKIPATIRSRCQRYDFCRIDAGVIESRLKAVAEQEGASIAEEAAALIARLADGALRDALSILDLCLDGNAEVTEQKVSAAAGLTDSAHRFLLLDALAAGDTTAALTLLDELYRAGCDMRQLCSELCTHARNLMLAKTLADTAGLIALPGEALEQLRCQAGTLTLEQVLRLMELFEETSLKIGRGAHGRGAVEMMLIRACHPEADGGDALLARVAALEAACRAGTPIQPVSAAPVVSPAVPAPPAKQPEPTPPPIETPLVEPALSEPVSPELIVPEPMPEPPTASAPAPEMAPADEPAVEAPPAAEPTAPAPADAPADGDLQAMRNWPEVLAALQSSNPLIYAVLAGSTAYIRGEYLLIDAQNQQFRELVKEGKRHRDSIRIAVRQVTGKLYGLGPYNREEQKKAAAADPLKQLISENKDNELFVIDHHTDSGEDD